MCHNNLLSATRIPGNGKCHPANCEIDPAASVLGPFALEKVKIQPGSFPMSGVVAVTMRACGNAGIPQ
jgi:hypothetical protein